MAKEQNTQNNSNNHPKPKKRVSVFVPVFVGVGSFLLGIGITLVAGFFLVGRFINTSAQSSMPSGFGTLSGVYDTIMTQYYKPVSSQKLISGAIDGMVKSLNDPFSEYLDNSNASDLNNTISASFGGIGASVKQSGDYVAIDAPIKGTPAAKAGLKSGDLILKIGNKSVKSASTDKVVAQIRGKIGTTVNLTLKRGAKTYSVTLTRAKIPVNTVTSNLDKNHKHVGNISISTFSEPTAKELKSAIQKLRKQGATSFIIDLRGNPGGTLPTALSTASMFLKNGQTIMQVQARTGKPEVFKAGKSYDNGFKVTEPTVVLVDDQSASASEIFASALKESAHDQVIGTQSFGKGTVQTVSNLSKTTEMKITTARWLTPDGNWINKKGVTPTIKADYPSYAYLSSFDVDKTYQLNQSSQSVITIQKILDALGYKVDQTNGVYDQSTQNAVKQFQASQKIEQSGTVDPTTGRALTQKLGDKISENDRAYDRAVQFLTQN